jgi:hypothetical protein
MELGRLEPVQPRTIWSNEARDFTPWLLVNADRLAEALGIDLELTNAEHPVGGFALDLIGRDLTNSCTLIVENQLEATDHTHLGQILTYAAGTGAATIVWVAPLFRDEHRQALDWLNENTAADIHFFGVQLRVVRIGESLPAPLFDVVAQPNDWQKLVREAGRADTAPTARMESYRQFWGRYLERVAAEQPSWTRAKVPPAQNWLAQPSPIPGCQLNAGFSTGNRLRHELYIDAGDAERNETILRHLAHHRASIEAIFGEALEWENLPNRRACRIAVYANGSVGDSERWDKYLDWFFDTGVRLRAALAAAPPVPAELDSPGIA